MVGEPLQLRKRIGRDRTPPRKHSTPSNDLYDNIGLVVFAVALLVFFVVLVCYMV